MQASLSTKVAQYQCCPFFNPTQKVIEPWFLRDAIVVSSFLIVTFYPLSYRIKGHKETVTGKLAMPVFLSRFCVISGTFHPSS
jgi:hypothetical protein